jgi:5-azacytidine-induced protein 1
MLCIGNLVVSHKLELQKLNDLHDVTEKVRREKWIEEKTKKIKVTESFSSLGLPI